MPAVPYLSDIQAVVSQYLPHPTSQTQRSNNTAGQPVPDNNAETEAYVEVKLEDIDIPEILDNTAKTMNDFFGRINGTFNTFLESMKEFFSGSSASSGSDTHFSNKDIQTVMNVIDSIPKPLQGYVDISKDQIEDMANQIEEVGLENYIRQCGDQYADMLPDGFVDSIIDDLKDGDTDKVYSSLMDIIDKQAGLPFKPSRLIGGNLKKSIINVIEMLSEKI